MCDEDGGVAMTVIVCLDNANGMMFNHRRQSRDANVVKDILKTINGASLLIAPYSVEDNGDGICFNVYCYNVQPDISINYATGDSSFAGTQQTEPPKQTEQSNPPAQNVESTYILNVNTKKFHYPSCSSVKQMSDKNKQTYTGSGDDLISQGYDPCKKCNP